MSIDSIRHRIASVLSVPPADVEVIPPGDAHPGLVRVGGRAWDLTPEMYDQDEELINRVVFACRGSAEEPSARF